MAGASYDVQTQSDHALFHPHQADLQLDRHIPVHLPATINTCKWNKIKN